MIKLLVKVDYVYLFSTLCPTKSCQTKYTMQIGNHYKSVPVPTLVTLLPKDLVLKPLPVHSLLSQFKGSVMCKSGYSQHVKDWG